MMNNLTEQCKQRKLPDGLYWVKHDGVINILDNYEAHLTEVEEVLAEVPSYDGYMTVIRAYNDVVDENTKLKERNDSLNNRDINLCRIANGIRDENFALKELLKECKRHFKAYRRGEKLVECRGKFYHIWKLALKEIDQVLGEE